MRLVDDDGNELDATDDETIGEVAVTRPEPLHRLPQPPGRDREAMRDGWFFTGDLATVGADGYWRIVGRRSTDLIKTGGYKVGAGEIEVALLDHPAVKEAAVTGEEDPDLGERIIAWVVPEDDDAGREGADRPRRRRARAPQAPARGALPRRAAAQRDGQGPEEEARGLARGDARRPSSA